MKPLISVIIPVYKVEKYIKKCIESIINQTYKNLEIILVDDGSPDKCGSICDKYAKNDKRIKVIHKENGGLSDARNAGIDICKGDYITFIDSDDYVELDYVNYLYKLISKFDADISICRFQEVYENGLKKSKKKINKYRCYSVVEALEIMLYRTEFDTGAWGKLYKKQLFKTIRYPKGKLFEDLATTYKLFFLADRISFGSQIKYYYLQRNTGIVKSNFYANKIDMIYIADIMYKDIVKKFPSLKSAAASRVIISNFHILLQMPNKGYDNYKKLIKDNITYHKNIVFRDKKATNFIKISIILFSIFNDSILKTMWQLTKNIEEFRYKND